MGVYKKGNLYWFIKHFKGKRYEESLGTDKKSLAEQVYAKKLTQIVSGEYGSEKLRDCTFSELVEKYVDYKKARLRSFRSIDNETRALEMLTASLAERDLSSITTRELEQIQSNALIKNKPATVNRKFDVLKHMFTKAADWDMISDKTLKSVRRVKRFKVNNTRLRFLSKEESLTLINACEPHLKPIVVFALNTGCRRAEILNLKWSEVDLRHGFVSLVKTKNGERRELPINNTLRHTLQRIARRLDVPYVFFDNASGKPYGDVKRSFHTALRRAGIKNFHFHDLRHTFASHLVMAGVDITSVSRLLGHKSLTMTLRYAHLAPSHLTEAVRKIDNYYDFTTVEGTHNKIVAVK